MGQKNDCHVGYVDYGGIINVDLETPATETLILQIVSLKNKFKCPIAYFVTNKCSSSIQSQILKVALIIKVSQ